MTRKMKIRNGLLVLAMAISLVFMIPAAGISAEQGAGQSQTGAAMEKHMGTPTGDQQQQASAEEPGQRIDAAVTTLQDMMDRQGERIPPEVIKNAKAIAIFPQITKAGLVVGGSYGTGVLMLHQNDQWNGPLFLSLYGASIGAQIGVQRSDLIMVINNEDALKEFQDGTLEFGAEASVAAGPYGEQAAANTQADIMAYQQTSGGFAGVSLSSGYIEVNPEADNKYFQDETGETRAYYPSAEEMMKGKKAPETEKAGRLAETLNQYGEKAGQQQ